MTDERLLVTGALGFIGAWVVHNLVRESVPAAAFDLASNPPRMKLIIREHKVRQVRFIAGNITD